MQNTNISKVERLLQSANLPYIDIEKHIHNFVFIENETKLIGCVGLEIYEDIALLRSLAVNEEYRNRGWGKRLTNEILQYAIAKKIKKLFLLTTTAEAFFAKLGFVKTNRSAAPKVIQTTSEFTTLCPENAVLMFKEL